MTGPALPVITTAAPLLHHSPGHDRKSGESELNEEENAALDVVTIAHLAMSLRFDVGSSSRWAEQRQNGIDELVAALEEYEETGAYPDALDKALDSVAIAHAAMGLEQWSGRDPDNADWRA